MNNAEKFQEVFGYYATEMWAKTEAEFLDWINEEHNERTGWIPVSERLPEQTGEYLVWAKWPCDEFATHSILHYDADVEGFGEWEEYYHPDTLGYLDSDFKEYAIEITAWQPLPDPYKGGDKE